MKIKIINTSKYGLPQYATESSAGCDLKANINNPMGIRPLCGLVISTGVFVEIPKGYEGQVRGRSGLNFKHNIIVPTGTIDADYRGEIKVKLYNLGEEPYTINPGDRIAQLIIAPVEQAEWVEVEELDETERGAGGFGSTGRK